MATAISNRLTLKREWFGLAASILAHVFVLLWALGSFIADPKPLQDEMIAVTLVPMEAAQRSPDSPSEVAPPLPELRPESVERLDEPVIDGDQGAPSSDAPASVGKATIVHPTTLSKDELDRLMTQLERCWSPPAGWTDRRQVSVLVRFLLHRDGTLNGPPAVIEFHASLLGKAAADEAIRTVLQCGPYVLPADKHDQWKDVQLRLEP